MVLKCLTFFHRHAKVQTSALLGSLAKVFELLHQVLMLLDNVGNLIGGSVLGNVRYVLAPVGVGIGAKVPVPHLTDGNKVRRVVLDKAQEGLLDLVLIALNNGTHSHAANIGYRVVSLGTSALGLVKGRGEGGAFVAAAYIVEEVSGGVLLPTTQWHVVVEHVADVFVVVLADDTALVGFIQCPLRCVVGFLPEVAGVGTALHVCDDAFCLVLCVECVGLACQCGKSGIVSHAKMIEYIIKVGELHLVCLFL